MRRCTRLDTDPVLLCRFSRNDPTVGLICKNADQSSKMCSDYKVRFSCHPPFCGGSKCFVTMRIKRRCTYPQAAVAATPHCLCPSLVAVCWTKWYDRDDPSGTGDWELLNNLMAENPGEIANDPMYIEVVTRDTLAPAISTGETFYM